MTNVETRSDFLKRKFPRLFLTNRGGTASPLADVTLIWPDRSTAPVLDMSEAGLLVASQGMLGQIRLGQAFEVKLRIGGSDPRSVQVKVLRLTAQTILLAIESLTMAGRLKMSQDERETLIRSSWRALNSQTLHPAFRDSEWWHSVFDTNLWIWKDENHQPKQLVIEFESVAWVWESIGQKFLKSPPAFDEAKGYVGPIADPLPNRVEPGFNWADRLEKVLGGVNLPESVVAQLRPRLPRTQPPPSPHSRLLNV